jgi:bifunctional DNA-binding transcriptional regulator/antitoxin component of YhaV-PrlF toxin-antitoxin module
MSTTYETEVKAKGRTLLPASLREEAAIPVGTRLMARRVSDGEVLLSTIGAVIREAQSDAPADSHAVEYLHAQRRAEAERAESRFKEQPAIEAGSVEAARERVLKALGIEAP